MLLLINTRRRYDGIPYCGLNAVLLEFGTMVVTL